MVTKAIIIPYFGKFNHFFEMFLSSCSYQRDYTFIIFTDDDASFNYPPNCRVNYISFDEIKHLFQTKFDFEISLNTPYKLCDFKPSYGDVFYDYIKEFDYWGFCDVDLIFGDLSYFYTDELLEKYDRISDAGHFSLFKNNKKMREAYKSYKSNDCYDYKIVFSSNKAFAFDEWGNNKGFNRILIDNGLSIFYHPILFADVRIDTYGLRLTKEKYGPLNSQKSERAKKHVVFYYESGVLKQYYLIGKNVFSEQQSYLHLQKRPMILKNDNTSKFIIVPPNMVLNSPSQIDYSFLKTIRERRPYLHYLKLRYNNLKRKIARSKKQK